jgi:hypothetical protein
MAYSGPATVLYRSRPVLQATTSRFRIETGNNDVTTMALGRAGHSKGPKKVVMEVENAIPQGGFEIDWIGLANAQEEVPLGFKIAGKTYECVGDIRGADVQSGTDGANRVSWEFHGRIVSET